MDNQPQFEQTLRQAFKYLNRFMVLQWRLGLGQWMNAGPALLGRYMVITHTGRKSGRRRRTPVNYAIVDGEVYCVAGFGSGSDWYRNLMANPSIEVWLADGWWNATAEEVRSSPKRLHLLRQVLIASGFAAYAAGVDPAKMSDEEIDRVTREYCLVRIHRTAARTGRGGPGDLAWVWPLTTLALLLTMLVRRGLKRKT